jgi:hypothetical protein
LSLIFRIEDELLELQTNYEKLARNDNEKVRISNLNSVSSVNISENAFYFRVEHYLISKKSIPTKNQPRLAL